MADAFLHLSVEDRREALGVAADQTGRPAHLLEKDVRVVWALATLYGSALGEHLVFKGGTSLAKAYQVIRRFSEDVDLTYDIRAIAPDLVGENAEAFQIANARGRVSHRAESGPTIEVRLPQESPFPKGSGMVLSPSCGSLRLGTKSVAHECVL